MVQDRAPKTPSTCRRKKEEARVSSGIAATESSIKGRKTHRCGRCFSPGEMNGCEVDKTIPKFEIDLVGDVRGQLSLLKKHRRVVESEGEGEETEGGEGRRGGREVEMSRIDGNTENRRAGRE